MGSGDLEKGESGEDWRGAEVLSSKSYRKGVARGFLRVPGDSLGLDSFDASSLRLLSLGGFTSRRLAHPAGLGHVPGHTALAAIRTAGGRRKRPQAQGHYHHGGDNTEPAKRMGTLYGFP